MPKEVAFVYLIKLKRHLGNPETHSACYYLGSTIDLRLRMMQHESGQGAAMLRACNERNIPYQIVKFHICPDAASARALELKLKAYKNHKRIVDLDWSKIMKQATVQEIRQQIQATGTLKFLSKVRKAIEETDPAIAKELDELILVQQVLK